MKKNNKRTASANRSSSPRPLPFRFLLAGLAVVGCAVAYPLFAVWKQAYITKTSLNHEQLADTIAALTQKATALRLKAEKLSVNERIESIARESLGLEYPGAQRIVIVRPEPVQRAAFLNQWRLFSVVRKSFHQEKG